MSIIGAYHPLLDDPVENSVEFQSASVLVTGSNMAGKTTYIKTVGVNVMLARTIWIAHATRLRIGEFEVVTAIKRDDSIADGESYYFAELKLILAMIERAGSEKAYLFLIDEIFRGTNTIERVGAAAAVLKVLGRTQMVFVTTHDIELVELLGADYEVVHFSETGEPTHPFDFQLKQGAPSGTNALKLLERLGYPSEIVKDATLIAKGLPNHFGS